MAVYVDQIFAANGPRGYTRWCHMFVGKDDDIEELHVMAEKIGLRRQWFQDNERLPHYDLVPSKRALAIKAGAISVGRHELVNAFRPRVNNNGGDT